MLCCCERNEQTASRIMSDYNIDLGEWVVSSVPSLMAKMVDLDELGLVISIPDVVHLLLVFVLVPCDQGIEIFFAVWEHKLRCTTFSARFDV